MRARTLFNPISPVYRRFQGFCALAVYLVALVGFPVPDFAQSTSATAYPCQHGRCGCATAEQCWRSCCCKSLEERLAWARENHVTPPAFVLRQLAETEALAVSKHQETASPNTCCKHQHGDAEIEKAACDRQSPRPETGQASPKSCCSHSGDAAKTAKQSSTTTWFCVVDAAKCSGIHSLWLALGTVIAPPANVDYENELSLTGMVSPAIQYRYAVSLSPPFPPPRA